MMVVSGCVGVLHPVLDVKPVLRDEFVNLIGNAENEVLKLSTDGREFLAGIFYFLGTS